MTKPDNNEEKVKPETSENSLLKISNQINW